ncbi:tyrosine-type recombinase/integrase [Maribacter sp. Asnod1-A12]|uniref:tyrosine-type recombinase/integrase n=1 Tax=Maribacter sp. Asnod1-A12 TaxID=3160576 RepID=UPI00386E509B
MNKEEGNSTNKLFTSVYGKHISEYIKLKRQLGYKYEAAESHLYRIDKFATETKEKGPGISYDFCNKWAKYAPNESDKAKYIRILYLKKLADYLDILDIETFIPKLPNYKKSTFNPFIFSPDEITRLFTICDNLEFTRKGNNVNLFSIPLLFRVLYATGIRRGEALSLLEENVNIKNKTLNVTDSKNGSQRLIPISDTLAQQCKIYLNYKKYLPQKTKDPNYFFVGILGEPLQRSTVYEWFKICITIMRMQPKGIDGNPRIHDLRHTFAVTSIVNMTNQGYDFNSCFPILSIYLGHSTLKSTENYIRLTTKMYPEVLKKLDTTFTDIFPKK